MKTFSKKHEIFFLTTVFIAVIFCTILSMFTEQILDWLPYFLEQHVFHRTFSHDSFKETMVSLLQYPVFILVFISAVFFLKLSDKGKSLIIIAFTISSILTLAIVSYTYAVNFTDQDLSSEMLFSKECFDKKTFWPTSWFYSMEFRFLNTQLLTAPFFFFTKNLSLIRTIQVILSECVLYLSVYFILNALKIKKVWLKLLCCLLAVNPISWTFFCYVNEGSYYIPHIVFSFIYIGLFLKIAYNEQDVKKQNFLTIIFLIFAFLSGLSSIRYILNFTFPLAAILLYNRIKEFIKNKEIFSFKKFFLYDYALKISLAGLILSGIGYIINSTVLSSLFTYKNMNKVRFNFISDMKVDSIIEMILSVIGYNENVSFSTPAGITNVLLFILAIFTVIVFTELYNKKNLEKNEKIFLQFVVFMAFFSLYTNICIEMVGRYLTMVVIYFVPFLALAVKNENISTPPHKKIEKWILCVSSSIVIMTNAYFCFGKMQTTNRSENIQKVSSFLLQNGYEFGYAFSNAANPIWFCTNGKIEVAQLTDSDKNGLRVIPSKFEIHKWLGPKKYLDTNYYKGSKDIFFAIRCNEFEASDNKKITDSGRLVYNDGFYMVFDYKSPKEFVLSFN